jgi:hypothetical protein
VICYTLQRRAPDSRMLTRGFPDCKHLSELADANRRRTNHDDWDIVSPRPRCHGIFAADQPGTGPCHLLSRLASF